MLKRIAGVSLKINTGLVIVSGIVIMLAMLYTTGDVIGRYTLNKPLPAAYEMTLTFLIYITFWGIAYVQSRGGHMRLGFIWERSGPRGKAALDTLSEVIGLFLLVIITWQGWEWAASSWTDKEVTMGIYTVPLFPARLGLAIGCSFLCIQYVIDLTRHISQLIIGREIEVPE